MIQCSEKLLSLVWASLWWQYEYIGAGDAQSLNFPEKLGVWHSLTLGRSSPVNAHWSSQKRRP